MTAVRAPWRRFRVKIAISLAAALQSLPVSLAWAQAGVAGGFSSRATALYDATGKIAASPFGENLVLVTVATEVTAPAFIRPIVAADARAASGLAAWQSGGSVLYTSGDCTDGAYVYTRSNPGLRASAQVDTPDGIVLYAGAIGLPTTVPVRSILYDTGCAAVAVEQNGLVAVDATMNLTATYPPPLSFR